MNCRICNEVIKQHDSLRVPEHMYGTGQVYDYVSCAHCLCLQIYKIPDDLAVFYPEDYYSFAPNRKRTFKNVVRNFAYSMLSRANNDFYPTRGQWATVFHQFGIAYSDRNRKIIDIGCGYGKLLRELHKYSFNELTGTDPFLKEEVVIPGMRILRLATENIQGSYDIVMSHHSLEHMPDPHVLFRKVKELLKLNGRFVLRIPIYPNYIWDIYREHWIQLDAPRHLYTFHLKTIEYLCDLYGFLLSKKHYDAHPWSIASTDFCSMGHTHKQFEKNVVITDEQIKLCDAANRKEYGDQVCLILGHRNV